MSGLVDSSRTGALASPDEALAALCVQLRPVDGERVPLRDSVGRVLAEAIHADRDRPACDLSLMDGYAVRLADLAQRTLEVAGEASIGREPPILPAGKTLRIFTGAPLPPGAEAVIQREHVEEHASSITLHPMAERPAVGLNVRRQGEHIRVGAVVLPDGRVLTPARIAALGSFGIAHPLVRRRVHVGIINTGDELVPIGAQPSRWQTRDASGMALAALLAQCAWLDVREPVRAQDEREVLGRVLADTLAANDAVLLTGGVSAGQYDFVPAAIVAAGGQTVFHRLPIRPGRPLLGAIGPQGQAILGLPGNPASTLVAACRFGLVALRRLAGASELRPRVPVVQVDNPDGKRLPLYWFRLVRLTGAGRAELVPTRGSDDVVALGGSDGFIEMPPDAIGPGPWPFYAWESGDAE